MLLYRGVAFSRNWENATSSCTSGNTGHGYYYEVVSPHPISDSVLVFLHRELAILWDQEYPPIIPQLLSKEMLLLPLDTSVAVGCNPTG